MRWWSVVFLVAFIGFAMGFAQAEDKSLPNSEKPADSPKPGAETQDENDTEKVKRLQESIKSDQESLAERQRQLKALDDQLKNCNKESTELDLAIKEKTAQLKHYKESGNAEKAAALESELKDIDKKRKLAEERFQLTIQERKTTQEQVSTLEQKIKRDQEALAKLLGSEKPNGTTTPNHEKTPEGQPKDTQPATTPSKEKKPTKEVIEAQKEAEAKEAAAKKAEEEARSVTERMKTLREDIVLEKKLLATAQEKADNLYETQTSVHEEMRKKLSAGAPKEEVDKLEKSLGQVNKQLSDVRAAIRQHTERLGDLQFQLAVLQQEEILVLQQAEQKRLEAEASQQQVENLVNPFSPRNLLQWLMNHGPRILMILLLAVGLLMASHFLERRFVHWLAQGGDRGTWEARQNRAQTLVGVFHHTASVAIVAGSALAICNEAGFDVTVLVGGAAVVGLAVAFGLQNILRDYFTGFLILLENQYTVNDIIKIGSHSGKVSRVTLRLTELRDLDGTVHFIPNGQITSVSNMTHDWSRALLDIPVAYKEDVDRVISILWDLATDLRNDPTFAIMILDNPEMLGVDSFGDSAVMIKFFIKTRPLKQWEVKRELLRRIKKKFDEVGIEIPFPHRTLFLRNPESVPHNGQSKRKERNPDAVDFAR